MTKNPGARNMQSPQLTTLNSSSPPPSASISQFIFANLAAERISVYPQNLRGAALVPMRFVQNAFDEALFEFADGFVEENSAIHHLRD